MIGMSKGALKPNDAPPSNDVKVSITPVDFVAVSSNGSYTTSNFESILSGGVGPYTYSWSFDEGNVASPTQSKTRISISGYNESVSGVLSLTVTDTGDGNKNDSSSTNVTVFFEDTFR